MEKTIAMHSDCWSLVSFYWVELYNNYHSVLSSEITRTAADGEGSRDRDGARPEQITYFDVYRERPIRLTVRALVPTKEHPKVTRVSSPRGAISYLIYFSSILWANCWDQRGIL